jgi:hypothetical protein
MRRTQDTLKSVSMDFNANNIKYLTHILHIKRFREELFHLMQQTLIIGC